MIRKQIVLVLTAVFLGVCFQAQGLVNDLGWTPRGTYRIGDMQKYSMPSDGEVYLTLAGLKPGNSNTFVANGSGASVEVVYTYVSDDELWEDVLAMSTSDLKTENQERCIVDYDAWTMGYIVIEDPEDREWKVSPKGYFLHVSGEEGATITVTSMSGAIEEPIPVGDIDNPLTISPSSVPGSYKAKYVDGAFYFTMNAKVGTYLLATTGGTEDIPVGIDLDPSVAEYTSSDVSASVSSVGNQAYLLTVTKAGEIGFSVSGTGESFGLTYQYAKEGTLGSVTVNTKGADATWSIKGASGSYANGETVPILGAQTIVFAKVKGFSTPSDQQAVPTEAEPNVVLTGVYNDTFDPKDDVVSGATKLSPSAKVADAPRTLFEGDRFDHFAFSAKDGYYYNFELVNLVGEADLVIFRQGAENDILAGPAKKVLAFSPNKGDYIVRVLHTAGTESEDAQYSLAYSGVNVGAISFAKTAVKAKKSAGSVTLSVKRSSGEGKVRVRYGTVNGTAKPGVDYVSQTGELVWENGDKKAKTITIKLLPELFAEEALSRQFAVQLKAVAVEELEENEYLASILSGKDLAVVTLTEAKGKPEKEIKKATTKTEDVPLETGTYQGVLTEDGSALTNGFPALASVVFTAKNAAKKALSAKVTVAGKSYSYAADAWDAAESDAETAVAVMTLQQKIGKEMYDSTLTISVKRGQTAKPSEWQSSGASVELVINIPDAKGNGVQEEIVYSGEIFRDNSKIQGYLDAVHAAAGYYTVALVPSGVSAFDGIPAGNGYLTLTIDAKGKAKIAGLLADGSTKPTYSSIVSVGEDGAVQIPVFVAKSPACFGGTLKLIRGEDGRYFVDSSNLLIWNNDNAALTHDGEDGWRIEVEPVGGYFNTVNNLQAYYLTSAFSVGTVDVQELPEEMASDGYSFVALAQANEFSLDVAGNAFAVEKRVLVKDGKSVDLENSVNPCNVQVKLARATGLVSGSFSLWMDDGSGVVKEKSGFKHNGVLLLSRDENASLDSDVMSAGFFTQKAKVEKRTYTVSLPFNILATDQGEPDWYADDWGEFEY